MTKQLQIMIIPHTHWDREWYQTFQQFRLRLVPTVDKLLDILDSNPRYTHFTLDGQTIILDDYLEVRPEQEERLKNHIRSGRVLVGPWYVQPDEFLVSGESLIRNLQIGLQRAAQFGTPMRIGYVPDSFGHIAQLPQILRGFGIDSAVFWRGVGEDVQQGEFCWVAPDGSEVLAIYLADPIGYSNARQLPSHPEEFIPRIELLTASLLPWATSDTLLFMNGSDHLEPQEDLPTIIDEANKLLSHIDPEHKKVLFKHYPPQKQVRDFDTIHIQIGTLPQYIARVRQQNHNFTRVSGEMRSSRYAHLLPAVLSSRIWIKQQNTATEHLLEKWVEPITAWAAALGAPYPTGLVGLAWRYLLQNHPHDSICGCSIDQVHRENSVRFAQSQQIGEGLLARATQAIAAQIDTTPPLPASHSTQAPIPIVVWNPAPGPCNADVRAEVQFPGSLNNATIIDERKAQMPHRIVQRWRQEIGSVPIARDMLASAVTLSQITTPAQFIQMAHTMIMSTIAQKEGAYVISRVHIEDDASSRSYPGHHTPQAGVVYIEITIAPTGRIVVNEQELDRAGAQVLSLLQREDIHTFDITLIDQARETVEFLAADLPAYGYKTFWLYPHGLREQTTSSISPLIVRPDSIENEFYRVEVNVQDGTLTVTDKENDLVLSGLNRFIDGGDIGDLYTYCPPEHDVLISEPVEPVKVELLNAGPARATLRVSGRWALPSACTANRADRSARTVICPILSDISLLPGTRRIEIHTSIENKAKDHRLRVSFPVSYTVERAVAEGTFEVRTRAVGALQLEDVTGWAEEPVNAFPQKRFVDLSDGKTGLAVLNRGLPEYEILQHGPGLGDGQSAVALTLLRCVEWLSRGDLTTRHAHAGPMEYTPEAQCQGRYEFDYALVPHQGTWTSQEALVLREAQAFNIPVMARVLVVDQHSGALASQMSLISVNPPELVVSAIKRSNNGQGTVVRIYNPLDHALEAKIRVAVPYTQIYTANLLEEIQESLGTSKKGEDIELPIGSGSIVTLIFV